jgi:hypothetical protein
MLVVNMLECPSHSCKTDKGTWLRITLTPKVKARVSGLYSSHDVEIASFKEMENFCKQDYYSIERKYPDWNFQENNEEYPPELYKQYLSYHEERIKRK